MKQPGAGVALAYNPDLLLRDDLIRGFVARQPLLERLLEDLRRESGQGAPQHHLILGQRGTGKTTLLRRLAFAIEDDASLNAVWQPLIFPEEQYNIADLGVFWLNCVDALSDALDRHGDTTAADELDAAVERIPKQPAARRDAALALLTSMAERLNKRLVLLVDNLDLVLERLDEQQDWAFRRVIAEERGLLLVGASSRALEAVYQYGRAFYDFFQVHELKGLSEAETLAVLRTLAEQSGQAAVAELVDRHPERIRAMRVLTGGNPRTVVLLYKVLAQGPDGDLERDLKQLLDLYTPLYKARFEDLGDQAQVIVDVLALHWDPATAAGVAARVDMPVNVVSAQLKRLEELGVVEKTPWFGEKKTAFQIAERFFNIWYLMRASRRVRRKLIWLVKFLDVWFTQDELKTRAQQHLAGGPGQDGERFAERAFAYAQAVRFTPLSTALDHAALHALLDDEAIRRRIDFSDLPAELQDKKERMLLLQALRKRVLEANVQWGGIEPAEFWRLLGGSPHYALNEKQRMVESLAGLPADGVRELYGRLQWPYQRLVRLYPHHTAAVDALYQALQCGDLENIYDWPALRALAEREDCRRLPAIAISTRILPQSAAPPLQAGELERAHSVLEQLAADDLCAALGWNGLGILLADHLKRYEEAEAAYRHAIELDPTYAWPWNNLGILLADPLKRYEEAEAAFRRAIELDPAFGSPWNGLGVLLQGPLKRHEEAEAAYRRAIELDPAEPIYPRNLGLLFEFKLHQPMEAGEAYLAAIRVNANDTSAIRNLRSLANEQATTDENAERVESWMREACELVPDEPGFPRILAQVLTLSGAWSEAQTWLARWAELAEESWDAHPLLRAIIQTRHVPETLAILEKTGVHERQRPLFEALKAVHAGTLEYLNRIAPEVREPATWILREIAPELL